MPLEIISYRFKRELHLHKCPICRETYREPNDVCGRISGDHIYPCMMCLQDQRRRLSDLILDAYLEPEEFERLEHVIPDAVSDYLDARDAAARHEQLLQVVEMRRKNPELFRPKTPEEQKEQAHRVIEELKDVAIKLDKEEIEAEMEKIREDEKI